METKRIICLQYKRALTSLSLDYNWKSYFVYKFIENNPLFRVKNKKVFIE